MNKFLVKAAKITGLKWSSCSWSRNARDNLRSGYQEKKMIEIDVDVPCLNTNKIYWQVVKLKWRNCYVFRQQHPHVAWDSGKEGTTRTGNQEQEQEQEPFKAQANFLMTFTLTWCLIYTLTAKLKVVSWGDMSCLIIVLFWISKGQLPVFISLPTGCSKSPIIFILMRLKLLLSRVRCIYSHNESWVIKLFMQFNFFLLSSCFGFQKDSFLFL